MEGKKGLGKLKMVTPPNEAFALAVEEVGKDVIQVDVTPSTASLIKKIRQDPAFILSGAACAPETWGTSEIVMNSVVEGEQKKKEVLDPAVEEKISELKSAIKARLEKNEWYLNFLEKKKGMAGKTAAANVKDKIVEQKMGDRLLMQDGDGRIMVRVGKGFATFVPHMAVIPRLSEDVCNHVMEPPQPTRVNSSYNSAYVKLNQRYMTTGVFNGILDPIAVLQDIEHPVKEIEIVPKSKPPKTTKKPAPLLKRKAPDFISVPDISRIPVNPKVISKKPLGPEEESCVPKAPPPKKQKKPASSLKRKTPSLDRIAVHKNKQHPVNEIEIFPITKPPPKTTKKPASSLKSKAPDFISVPDLYSLPVIPKVISRPVPPVKETCIPKMKKKPAPSPKRKTPSPDPIAIPEDQQNPMKEIEIAEELEDSIDSAVIRLHFQQETNVDDEDVNLNQRCMTNGVINDIPDSIAVPEDKENPVKENEIAEELEDSSESPVERMDRLQDTYDDDEDDEFNIFADGSVDDLFPEDDLKTDPVRFRKIFN